MMNKSKIEWCDFSWNPVTGCRFGCSYCYAAKQARRFSGDIRLNLASPQIQHAGGRYILENPFKNRAGKVIPYPAGFEPTLHRYRLPDPARKKKPAAIFVCSMADLFANWVVDEWIREVFAACAAAPWHSYLFLTKNPGRYIDLAAKNLLPTVGNHWYGSTVTGPETEFFWHDKLNTFVSIEPILEPFADVERPEFGIGKVRWVILGAETGTRRGKVRPRRDWVEVIIRQARAGGASVFMKPSREMQGVWGRKLIQEWPDGMVRSRNKVIPHCKECVHCNMTSQGKRGVRRECGLQCGRYIPGRYARTSPPWCPRRGKGESR